MNREIELVDFYNILELNHDLLYGCMHVCISLIIFNNW